MPNGIYKPGLKVFFGGVGGGRPGPIWVDQGRPETTEDDLLLEF